MMLVQPILAILSGGGVGFTLGLIGGGGSILATPLLLTVVGLPPHQAIGTGALAVSVSAFGNFAAHFRAGTVRWRSASLFAAVGVVGAYAGSYAGKAIDGARLLFLFAILMIAIGLRMARGQGDQAVPAPAPGHRFCTRRSMPRIGAAALAVGALSGFFGIGGGFLIVPSLLAVGSFGATTALN